MTDCALCRLWRWFGSDWSGRIGAFPAHGTTHSGDENWHIWGSRHAARHLSDSKHMSVWQLPSKFIPSSSSDHILVTGDRHAALIDATELCSGSALPPQRILRLPATILSLCIERHAKGDVSIGLYQCIQSHISSATASLPARLRHLSLHVHMQLKSGNLRMRTMLPMQVWKMSFV